jgi:hypothetical protein
VPAGARSSHFYAPANQLKPKEQETAMVDLAHCLAILKALGISEVKYCLSGGGDSGTAELEHVLYCDGRHGPLPTVTVGITDRGGTVCLDEDLDRIVALVPVGDWCNNEGGYGTVVLRPQENEEDLQVECDMTYGEESEDQDFEDDEEFFTPDPDRSNPDTPPETIAVDDSNLKPAKGDAP